MFKPQLMVLVGGCSKHNVGAFKMVYNGLKWFIDKLIAAFFAAEVRGKISTTWYSPT